MSRLTPLYIIPRQKPRPCSIRVGIIRPFFGDARRAACCAEKQRGHSLGTYCDIVLYVCQTSADQVQYGYILQRTGRGRPPITQTRGARVSGGGGVLQNPQERLYLYLLYLQIRLPNFKLPPTLTFFPFSPFFDYY